MKIRWPYFVFRATLTIALLLSAVCAAQTPVAMGSNQRTSARPVYDAVEVLQSRYAVPITYEDPILLSRGDMESWISDESNPMAFFPKRGVSALPEALVPARTPRLDSAALGSMLDLLHQVNADGPHFRILESKYGFHVAPVTSHDAGGHRVSSSSILDVNITVPEERRMPSEHFVAVCKAVAVSSGIHVDPDGQYMDQWFALNGLIPPKVISAAGEEQKRQFSFAWGAQAMTARDALISLLEQSATTLSWRVLCQPSTVPQNRACTLNLGPIQIATTGPCGEPTQKALSYDRCTKCPPLRQSAPCRTVPTPQPR